MELGPENLAQPEAGCTCLGAAERTPDIKFPKLACGSSHSRIFEALPSRALKNLGQLWIAVDRSKTRVNDRFRHIGGKRTPQQVKTRALATFWWETYATEAGCRKRRLLPTLHLDGLDGRGSGLGVKVAAADLDRLQVVVEFVDQRNASRNIEADHGFIAHLVQVLNQRPY